MHVGMATIFLEIRRRVGNETFVGVDHPLAGSTGMKATSSRTGRNIGSQHQNASRSSSTSRSSRGMTRNIPAKSLVSTAWGRQMLAGDYSSFSLCATLSSG